MRGQQNASPFTFYMYIADSMKGALGIGNCALGSHSPFSYRPQCSLFTPKTLHNYCLQFLLGITVVPRKIEDNCYAKFWGVDKVDYGLCENG